MTKIILADGTTITLGEGVKLPLEIPVSAKLTLKYESGLTEAVTLPKVVAIIH